MSEELTRSAEGQPASLTSQRAAEVKFGGYPGVFEPTFQFFKERILEGELRPGDRLLPERELSQKLGVSRASLREVMRVLALLGVVEIRPGQGAFVCEPNLRMLQDFFSLVLAMQPSVYEHLIEARMAIEFRAIRLACRQAGPEDRARLVEGLNAIQSTVEDADLGGEADFAFHEAIVHASGNQVLILIYEAVASQLRRSHQERRQAVVDKPEVVQVLTREHAKVYEAILAGDPDRAEAVLRDHFELAERAAPRHPGAASGPELGSK